MEKSRVATIGTFDGVHRGHLAVVGMLKDIAANRNLIPTVFAFAGHPLEVIAPERVPAKLMTFEAQKNMFANLGVEVIPIYFDESIRTLSARQYMEMIRDRYGVRVLVVGYDNRFGCNRSEGFCDYERYGKELQIEVLQAPEITGVSSTIIRRLIEAGNVAEANEKLGYTYSLEGKVEHGRHLGSTIGFPTANMAIADMRRLIPGDGVYAAEVLLADGKRRGAMVNIGHRPTIDDGRTHKSIEVNIFDFVGDIYGQEIKLMFVEFMRKEYRMNSLEELKNRLIQDRAEAQKILQKRKLP